jgi:type III pantothenate kinase
VAEQIVLIDQGNTRLKWVLAVGGDIDEASAGHGNFEAFCQAFGPQAPVQPQAIMFSSVASEDEANALVQFCLLRWGVEAQLLTSTKQRGGVRNAYDDPGMLGVDRWLAIVGAVSSYGTPVVVWDLGTASTLDAVDAAGQHLGGMIYPGPATMARSLTRDTRLKVPPDLEGASTDPGDSTPACIRNGVFAAQVGALNMFLRSVSGPGGEQPKIIITGGAANAILPALEFDYIHDPWLVFRGMLVD